MTLDPKAADDARHAFVGPDTGSEHFQNASYWFGALEDAITAYLDALASRSSAIVEEPMAAETREMIEQMVAGTAPMSRWMASVDYSTYGEFEEYLKAQLREKLQLKAVLDRKRAERDHEETLATFVDGGTAAIEGALATYRVVRQREAASPQPHTGRPDLATIEATARKINPGRSEDHIKSVALDALSIIRALNAALTVEPEAGEVTVKPLEWQEVWAGSNEDIPAWRGTAAFGWSTTIDFAYDHSVQKHADAPADKLAAKKAKAQADYTARIRSALAP